MRISSVDRARRSSGQGRRDGWIARRRVESENRFNADRGERMVDIVASKRIPDAITYEASGLEPGMERFGIAIELSFTAHS